MKKYDVLCRMTLEVLRTVEAENSETAAKIAKRSLMDEDIFDELCMRENLTLCNLVDVEPVATEEQKFYGVAGGTGQ